MRTVGAACDFRARPSFESRGPAMMRAAGAYLRALLAGSRAWIAFAIG